MLTFDKLSHAQSFFCGHCGPQGHKDGSQLVALVNGVWGICSTGYAKKYNLKIVRAY